LVGFVDPDLGHRYIIARRATGHNPRMTIAPFTELAHRPDPPIDELALALAAEFEDVDADAALARLDGLGEEVAAAHAGGHGPSAGIDALREVLGVRHGFCGERERYDHPHNSMLNVVLERRRGLPILLSVLYVATARRAGIALEGVGLPGHYVAGDFATSPPLLLDPFAGGAPLQPRSPRDVRPWGAHETALRMLNNLVASFGRRADLMRTIQAAELRLALPLDQAVEEELHMELGALRARLN
jgi:regulator of sirC expression with transglutaminase-like and TPR domain